MIPFNRAIEVHKKSIIKNGTTEGFFNVFIFRKISIVLSWVLANLKISPNFISILAFSLNISAGILLLIDFEMYAIQAIILIATGHILDMSDGEVARLRNKQSAFGAFLDPFLDRILDIALPLMIGFSFISQNESISNTYFYLVIVYVSLKSVMYYLDLVSSQLNLNSAINNLRSTEEKFYGQKYIKWDGGFTIVLYSVCIYFSLIIPLFIFLDLFYILLLVLSLKQIIGKL